MAKHLGFSAAEEIDKLRETIAQHEIDYTALEVAHAALERSIAQARELLTTLDWNDWSERVDAWLAANPSQEAERTA